MPPARRITPWTRSAGASRVSSSDAATHLQVSPSVLSTCAHDLKVPLPPKTPLSPAFPGSTTVLMARSPCPLPSAACPRTPPSHPPLELLPTCSAVTQVARTAVHGGEHPPLFQGMFPLFAPPPSGLTCPVLLLLEPCGCALNAYLSQRHALFLQLINFLLFSPSHDF